MQAFVIVSVILSIGTMDGDYAKPDSTFYRSKFMVAELDHPLTERDCKNQIPRTSIVVLPSLTAKGEPRQGQRVIFEFDRHNKQTFKLDYRFAVDKAYVICMEYEAAHNITTMQLEPLP